MDVYSTHLDGLNKIINFIGKPKNVVEFGTGNYSTEFLIKNSESLMSIEMQSIQWFNDVVSKFKHNENWRYFCSIGPMSFLDIEYPETIDFTFVDGHGESRPECINFMMGKNCPIIVAHDTETSSYGWDRVNSDNGYKRFDFKYHSNWTTLWTNNNDLFNHLINE